MSVPAPEYPLPPAAPRRKPRRGAAITALVLGIVALAGSPLPILNNATIIAGIIGIPFAVVGILGTKRATAIVGGVLSAAGVAAGLGMQTYWSSELDKIGDDLDRGLTEIQREADREMAVPAAPTTPSAYRFTVRTTGSGINSVTYFKPGFTIAQDTAVKGKTFTAEATGYADYEKPNLTAQNGRGGAITCVIERDGAVVSENSSNGAYAMVTCG